VSLSTLVVQSQIMLANLDNEVIFKKAFTDPIVFHAFVKDVLGIDVQVDKIETEKQFEPKIGHIAFKLDIFAESEKDRVIIEIQRVVYDHNFDRFLHYFMMSIVEMQSSHKKYGIDKTVYSIVVMTAPYEVKDKSGHMVLNEVMVSNVNPRDLRGKEVALYNHQMVFLNAYHKDPDTPSEIRDWLDLIYQSIHEYNDPKINLNKSAIKRAAEIIDVSNLTPEEKAERLKFENIRAAFILQVQIEMRKAIINAHESGIDINTMSKIFNKTPEEIQNIINENS